MPSHRTHLSRGSGVARQGDPFELTITNLGTEGQGIGRRDGLVVFVPGALPGDRVLARPERSRPGPPRRATPETAPDAPDQIGKRRFLKAELVRVVSPSDDRVASPCDKSPICGGCDLLSLSYEAQLAWKTGVVREALRRVGGLGEVPVRHCLGATQPLAYRNKAQFPVKSGRDGRGLAVGLYRRGTHDIVPVDNCVLQHPLNNRILSETARLARGLRIPAHNEDTGEGLLRHILARVSSDGREAMVVLVTAKLVFPPGRRLAAGIRQVVPEVKTVVQNVNSRRTNVILGGRDIVLSGSGYIHDCLGGVRLRVSSSAFLQVNPRQAEVLYALVAEWATGARRVADIYCGVGAITLFLAGRLTGLEEIVGVEANPAAVRDAAANARANGISSAVFVVGDASVVLRDMARAGAALDTIVLDPPRKGCEPAVLEALSRLACPRIIYVSCNPATLARDAGILASSGYRVVQAQPVDMFPQTTHVETVALIRRG
jgi:23S rRNA (uracil1939-C5)-methyltransferase